MKSTLTRILLYILGGFSGFLFLPQSGSLHAQCAGRWAPDWEAVTSDAGGGTDIIADDDQNVYVVGIDFDQQSFPMLLVKYDMNGTELWRRTYSDGGNQSLAIFVEFDFQGNVVVSGFAFQTGNVVTLSYSPDGNLRWVNSLGTGGNLTFDPFDLATDHEGNSYVTGMVGSGISQEEDLFVIKYDSLGSREWVQVYNNPSNTADIGRKVSVGTNGDVYIGGESNGNFLTQKYDEFGNLVWTRSYDGPNNLLDAVTDMEISPNGDVIVTGSSYTGRATVRYSTNGTQKWLRISSGPFNSEHSLAIDQNGESVFISSSINGSDGIQITCYDMNGTSKWVRSFSQNGDGLQQDIQIDENQNVYVLGEKQEQNGPGGAIVLVYNKSGKKLYSNVYTFNNVAVYVRELALSCGGNLFFGAWDEYGTEDILVVKYEVCNDNKKVLACPGTNKVEETDLPENPEAGLTIWPNPISENTNIRFVSPAKGEFSLEIFTLHGLKAGEIWNGNLNEGEILEVPFLRRGLPSGFYLLQSKGKNGETFLQKVLIQ